MVKRTSAPRYRDRMGMSIGSTHSRLLWSRIATNTIYKNTEILNTHVNMGHSINRSRNPSGGILLLQCNNI